MSRRGQRRSNVRQDLLMATISATDPTGWNDSLCQVRRLVLVCKWPIPTNSLRMGNSPCFLALDNISISTVIDLSFLPIFRRVSLVCHLSLCRDSFSLALHHSYHHLSSPVNSWNTQTAKFYVLLLSTLSTIVGLSRQSCMPWPLLWIIHNRLRKTKPTKKKGNSIRNLRTNNIGLQPPPSTHQKSTTGW